MKTEQQNPSHESILIVDDSPSNLLLLANILNEHDYRIRLASNGARAIATVQAEPPDLILLDIKMPDMSGYEVCKALKTDEHTRDIPVMFISALGELEDKVKGFSLGGVDYITKPFQAEEVLARVETHLKLQHLQWHLKEQNVKLQKEIHERKQVEEELISYKEHLEELVEQRTRELQQSNEQLQIRNVELQQSKEALQQANETAEIANRAKSEFIANISHELRTPLNHVLGYAQLLAADLNLTEKQKERIKKIQQGGEHLLVFINDLIDLSTLEAGKMTLDVGQFDLIRFLQQIAGIFQIRAEQQQLSFVPEFSSALPKFGYGDAKRLRQILLNLLGNAFKFTKEGSIGFRVAVCSESRSLRSDVTVSEEQHSEAPGPCYERIRFEVEDTGVGIPPEHLEAIFTAFHQIGNKWLAQTEGIGLGLTICQRLCRMMGSALQVKSTVGQGSLFWFDLDVPEVGTHK